MHVCFYYASLTPASREYTHVSYHLWWAHVWKKLIPLCVIKKIPEQEERGMFAILAFPSDSVFVLLANTRMWGLLSRKGSHLQSTV